MKKNDFLKKWRSDCVFRFEMKQKGIQVIQDNVIFFDADGNVRAVAGQYVQ